MSPLGSSFVSIVGLIWDVVSPLWSSLGSRVLCIMRACIEPTSDPRLRPDKSSSTESASRQPCRRLPSNGTFGPDAS